MGERFYRYSQMILLVWLTMFGLLVIYTHQEFTTNRSVVPPLEPAPLPTVVESVPQPLPPAVVEEPAPEPKERILAVGKRAGKGSFGVPQTSGTAERIEVRLPYTGTLGEYRTFKKGGQVSNSRSFDLMGSWDIRQGKFYVHERDCPVRLIQIFRHDGHIRLSVVFNDNCPAYNGEVRYTDDTLIFCLTPATEASQAQNGASKK